MKVIFSYGYYCNDPLQILHPENAMLFFSFSRINHCVFMAESSCTAPYRATDYHRLQSKYQHSLHRGVPAINRVQEVIEEHNSNVCVIMPARKITQVLIPFRSLECL